MKRSSLFKPEIKLSGYLLFVFLEKLLYEICLVRIKEQIVEKRSSTVGTHMNVDNVETHVYQTNNMLSNKNSHIWIMSLSKIFFFRIRLVFKDLRLPKTRYL